MLERAMDYRHLRYFVAVAEELHFTRAAARVHISQQPLSQQIKKLENELGVDLFRRTSRSVELTEAGRVFLGEVRGLFAQTERAVKRAKQAANGELGELTVGYSGSTLYNVMPESVRLFSERYPEVTLKLRELCTPEQEEALLSDVLDVGLLALPVSSLELAYETLLSDPLVAALPAHHPLTRYPQVAMYDLRREPFVLYERAQKMLFHDLVVSLCYDAGFTPRVTQYATTEQAVVGLVAAGAGVAIVTASQRHLERAGVAYRALRDVTTTVEIAVAWRRNDTNVKVKNFVDGASKTQAVD